MAETVDLPPSSSTPPVGRLAPSPTGVLHVGNARSLLLAWLSARARGGRVLLRVEDLITGPPRHVASLLSDLTYLGLDWDSPDMEEGVCEVDDFVDLDADLPGFILQSQRHRAYERVLGRLVNAGLVYPCVCTRKEIERALRAPHAEDRGPAYPGTCEGRFRDLRHATRWEAERALEANRKPFGVALRLRAPPDPLTFVDGLRGRVKVSVSEDSGDFVVRRKDGSFAYMLAVVIDDLAMGVDEVVRGDDLLDATGQQLAVYEAIARHGVDTDLDADPTRMPPVWFHVPLVYGDDGRRLAKRDKSLHVQTLQEMGVPGEKVRRWMARSLGLPDSDDPAELAAHFDWATCPRGPVVFGETELAKLRLMQSI